MGPMRRPALLGLATAVTGFAVLAVQAVTVLGGAPTREGVHTVPRCPQPAGPVAGRPAHLVADLERAQPREDVSRAPLLAAADQVVSGQIPPVLWRGPDDAGDPLRYLYDEGVALRRIVGVLGYAYASTHDPRYLDSLAAQTVGASRWPDWNPGHPLDTAQVATAVSLGYAWSQDRMTPQERSEVVAALADRLLRPYACGAGSGLATRRTGVGNQTTVVGTAALLAGLAIRADDPSWSAAAVEAATRSLERSATADGSGRSLADGPTVEGLMYTTYEAANVALLQATLRANPGDPEVSRPLQAVLPSLDALADWNERCGKVADPAVEDGWDLYPWVDRTTALAAMAASPRSGPHLLALVDALQARGQVTVPGAGTWAVPDGIAELVLGPETPGQAAVPPVQAHVAGGPPAGRLYGCATHGDTYALLTGVPNDAPHGHADVGNVVVKQGEQDVLADLGQRNYTFTGGPVWRSGTKAHSTIGVLGDDGGVRQRGAGGGAVSAEGDGLLMTSTSALEGVGSWQRRVTVGDGTVQVRDTLSGGADGPVPLSASFLLAAPVGAVAPQPDGALRFTVADGSVWDLVPPAGTTVTWAAAAPTPPYVDAPDIAGLAAAHTLVVLRADLAGSLDLVTELRRVG
jgi:hypothetical protein